MLAMSQVFAGDPDSYKRKLERVRTPTAVEVQQAAKLAQPMAFTSSKCIPFPTYQDCEVRSATDRSCPPPARQPERSFPKLQRATLSNGLKIVLAERHAIPVVDLRS